MLEVGERVALRINFPYDNLEGVVRKEMMIEMLLTFLPLDLVSTKSLLSCVS